MVIEKMPRSICGDSYCIGFIDVDDSETPEMRRLREERENNDIVFCAHYGNLERVKYIIQNAKMIKLRDLRRATMHALFAKRVEILKFLYPIFLKRMKNLRLQAKRAREKGQDTTTLDDRIETFDILDEDIDGFHGQCDTELVYWMFGEYNVPC